MFLKKVSLTKIFVMTRFAYPKVIAAFFSLLFTGAVIAQTAPCPDQTQPKCCPGYPNMVQTKRENLTIPGTPYFKGLLEYLPPAYDAGSPQKYPLIIYFHGLGETGTGTNTDLCRLLNLQSSYTENNQFDIPLPERIELGQVPSVTYLGTTYNYIVLSPQYNQYIFPSAYPSAADVSAFITWALTAYPKIDPTRIYLTGMSSGANLAMEFAASSLVNANRIAGVAVASLCSTVGNWPQGPANIANADLAVWALHCITDDFPINPPGYGCPDTLVNNWINKINAFNPTPLAKKTTLGPTGPRDCNTGFTHNTWNTLYDPTFVVDGRNIYNWFIQFTNTAAGPLPANMKNYNAVLRGSKVYVEWITASENNTANFVLERANANGQFQEVATVMAAGTSAADKKYVLIDEQPARGLNLYRLVLVNKDGQREYFDIKRITLPNGNGYVNIPSPAKGTLNIYVNVERSQNVSITIHDVNGRLLNRINKLFTPGLSENRVTITTLAAGTYFVKVEGETFAETRKVLVN